RRTARHLAGTPRPGRPLLRRIAGLVDQLQRGASAVRRRMPAVAVAEVGDRAAGAEQHHALARVAQPAGPLASDERRAAISNSERLQVLDHHDALTRAQLVHTAVAKDEADAGDLPAVGVLREAHL